MPQRIKSSPPYGIIVSVQTGKRSKRLYIEALEGYIFAQK